jgi:hypothetical protein
MQANWSRLWSLTGLVFGCLIVATILVSGSTPDSDWSAQRVVSFYETHDRSQNAIVYMLGYGALFMLLFAAALRSHLHSRSHSDGLVALGFGGGIVLAVGLAIAAAITSSAIDAPGKISPAAEQALSVLNNDLFFISLLIGIAGFAIGNGIAIARSDRLPRWLGWVAIVIGIAAVIPPIGWFALIAVSLWAVIVSIAMFLRPEHSQPTSSIAS